MNGRQIATNLCVHESTVWRVIEKFRASGEVSKKKYPSDAAVQETLLFIDETGSDQRDASNPNSVLIVQFTM